jgi:hypothetical protein
VGEWIAIEHWDLCAGMERPGIIFEIRNATGNSLFTNCVDPLPPMPFDWVSPALEFRTVVEPPPVHSGPIPEPGG